MTKTYKELRPPLRLLMGPGPSDVHPRVLRALSIPPIGHLDPEFLLLMNETMELLRSTFATENALTIPVSGTGSAGMEAALCNVIEPGDEAIVCVNGLFGERMCDIVERCGGKLIRVDAEWGTIVEAEQVRQALANHSPKLVAIVHVETSTGVLQPLKEIGQLARQSGALFVVDAVTSLAGVPVEVDANGIDICYSGTQKCLSCPPGIAPITFSPRAVEVIHNRRSKVVSWYLDMTMISQYWGKERFYHHTAPINMIYATREALRLVHEEGLEARYRRHQQHSAALCEGLQTLGMRLAAQEGHRAPMLTLVEPPAGVDEAQVRRRLLDEFGIEIGGGLGKFKGRMWRIGLMGESCRRRSVVALLDALESCI